MCGICKPGRRISERSYGAGMRRECRRERFVENAYGKQRSWDSESKERDLLFLTDGLTALRRKSLRELADWALYDQVAIAAPKYEEEEPGYPGDGHCPDDRWTGIYVRRLLY